MTDTAPLLTCRKCGEAKPATIEFFHTKVKDSRTGFCGACRKCVNKQRKARYRGTEGSSWKARTERSRRELWLKRKYGITHEEYDTLFLKQGKLCAICRLPPDPSGRGRFLEVDHCHATSRVRALLCHLCNVAVGAVRENPRIALALADYIDTQQRLPFQVKKES